MDAEQEQVRRFVRQLIRVSALKPTQLARQAGLAPSTLTRFLNSKDVKHAISARTLLKLVEASGASWPVLRLEDHDDVLSSICERVPPADKTLVGEILKGILRARGIEYPNATASSATAERGRKKGRR